MIVVMKMLAKNPSKIWSLQNLFHMSNTRTRHINFLKLSNYQRSNGVRLWILRSNLIKQSCQSLKIVCLDCILNVLIDYSKESSATSSSCVMWVIETNKFRKDHKSHTYTYVRTCVTHAIYAKFKKLKMILCAFNHWDSIIWNS